MSISTSQGQGAPQADRRAADPGRRRPDARPLHLGRRDADIARGARAGDRHRPRLLDGRRRGQRRRSTSPALGAQLHRLWLHRRRRDGERLRSILQRQGGRAPSSSPGDGDDDRQDPRHGPAPAALPARPRVGARLLCGRPGGRAAELLAKAIARLRRRHPLRLRQGSADRRACRAGDAGWRAPGASSSRSTQSRSTRSPFNGLDLITPNKREALQLAGIEPGAGRAFPRRRGVRPPARALCHPEHRRHAGRGRDAPQLRRAR